MPCFSTAVLFALLHVIATQCGILDSFNERLHKLEDTIRPIHDETTKLKRLQGSIRSTAERSVGGVHCVGQLVHTGVFWSHT